MSVLAFIPRFRGLERLLRDYEARESWSSGEIAAYQLQRLNAVWKHAIEHVEYYRDLAVTHRLPQQFVSLAEFSNRVPVLRKDLVRQSPGQFLSAQKRPGQWQRSGGSTGIPTAIYWEHESHREMLRGKYRSEQAHGLSVFDRKVVFWGHGGSFSPGWRGVQQRLTRPIEDKLRNRLRVSAYDITCENLRRQLPVIRAFAPQSIYGYSCAVHLLARAAESDQGIPGLKVAVLTAEPAGAEMLDCVATNLGCKAVIEYGAVECGLMAYSMPDGTLRTRDDLVLIETLPNALGSHDIVVTVLNNPSFPLLRYAIEDTTPIARHVPERGFGILQEICGRSNDWLIGKHGRKLHSMAVKHTLEDWPQIRRFTVLQKRCGDLQVVLETPDCISETLLGTLRTRLEEMLEGYHVEMKTVDFLPGNLAGKHRWIVSELAAREYR
jgi:phenylacetate-CoA ligase